MNKAWRKLTSHEHKWRVTAYALDLKPIAVFFFILFFFAIYWHLFIIENTAKRAKIMIEIRLRIGWCLFLLSFIYLFSIKLRLKFVNKLPRRQTVAVGSEDTTNRKQRQQRRVGVGSALETFKPDLIKKHQMRWLFALFVCWLALKHTARAHTYICLFRQRSIPWFHSIYQSRCSCSQSKQQNGSIRVYIFEW